uniref:Uncharacterized protein n=1 Tax=Sipha flava TaxID=143950 RepID=A0A2S2QLN0_9HEMI
MLTVNILHTYVSVLNMRTIHPTAGLIVGTITALPRARPNHNSDVTTTAISNCSTKRVRIAIVESATWVYFRVRGKERVAHICRLHPIVFSFGPSQGKRVRAAISPPFPLRPSPPPSSARPYCNTWRPRRFSPLSTRRNAVAKRQHAAAQGGTTLGAANFHWKNV